MVCSSCRKPVTDDAYLCLGEGSCSERLEIALGDVGALVALSVAGYSGMALVTRPPGRGGDPDPDGGREQTAKIQPLPWDEATSRALRSLRVVLVGWVRVVVEERRFEPDRVAGPVCQLCTHRSCRATRTPGWPADTLPAMALWLLAQVPWLRRHPASATCLGDVELAVDRLGKAMDRAPMLIYAGPCVTDTLQNGHTRRCGHDMYALPDSPTVKCPACRTAYNVPEQRALMLEAARDYLLSVVEIVRALTALHERIGDDRIRKWAARGRLTVRGHNASGAPIYRLGDVQDLLDESDVVGRRCVG